MRLTCRYGEVYPYGGEILQGMTDRPRLGAKLRALPFVLAARIANLPSYRPAKESRSIDPLTQEVAGNALAVSEPSVKRAKRVLATGSPALIRAEGSRSRGECRRHTARIDRTGRERGNGRSHQKGGLMWLPRRSNADKRRESRRAMDWAAWRAPGKPPERLSSLPGRYAKRQAAPNAGTGRACAMTTTEGPCETS